MSVNKVKVFHCNVCRDTERGRRLHLFYLAESDRLLQAQKPQHLDRKLDRAMGRGGTEHRLTSIKFSVLGIQYVFNEMCIRLKPLKC